MTINNFIYDDRLEGRPASAILATRKHIKNAEILAAIDAHETLARDIHADVAKEASLGIRAADAVARVGGSWGFVIAFGVFLTIWAGVNLLLPTDKRFDPYPFIFLNLILSTIAAIQAPIIMMSQNRQAEKDRIASEHDYEINLKAELEITLLNEKLDQLHRDHKVQFAAILAKLDAQEKNMSDKKRENKT